MPRSPEAWASEPAGSTSESPGALEGARSAPSSKRSTLGGNGLGPIVVVQGDTSAIAGAIAANTRSIPLVHVEAGLRSFDRGMPEEHDRVVTDHLADLCLAPTDVAAANLAREGSQPPGRGHGEHRRRRRAAPRAVAG